MLLKSDLNGTVIQPIVDLFVTHRSGINFTATYASASTITISGITVENDLSLVYLKRQKTDGEADMFINGLDGKLTIDGSTVTVDGLTLNATDKLELGVNAHRTRYNELEDSDVAAGTSYFPDEDGIVMDGFKDLSITGKIADADGTVTITPEVTNDEAGAEWINVYGYDTKNNSVSNEITVTEGELTFSMDFDNLNYRNIRFKIVTSGSTNSVKLFTRMK